MSDPFNIKEAIQNSAKSQVRASAETAEEAEEREAHLAAEAERLAIPEAWKSGPGGEV